MLLSLAFVTSACGTLLAVDEDASNAGAGGGGSTADGGGSPSDDDATGGTDASTSDGGAEVGVDAAFDAPFKPSQHRVFVTSSTVKGGALQAALGTMCSGVKPGNWVPWVFGAAGYDPLVLQGKAPWYLIGQNGPGSKVADTLSELQNDTLMTPIDLDESGNLVANAYPWTGTTASDTCGGWNSIFGDGTTGYTGASDGSWQSAGPHACTDDHPIYCFETE